MKKHLLFPILRLLASGSIAASLVGCGDQPLTSNILDEETLGAVALQDKLEFVPDNFLGISCDIPYLERKRNATTNILETIYSKKPFSYLLRISDVAAGSATAAELPLTGAEASLTVLLKSYFNIRGTNSKGANITLGTENDPIEITVPQNDVGDSYGYGQLVAKIAKAKIKSRFDRTIPASASKGAYSGIAACKVETVTRCELYAKLATYLDGKILELEAEQVSSGVAPSELADVRTDREFVRQLAQTNNCQ